MKKKAIEALLQNARLYPFTPGRYTVRTKKGNAIVRVSGKTARELIDVSDKCRGSDGKPYWIIERRALQRLHGNDWRYKAYRGFLKKQSLLCSPCKGITVIKYTQPI
jgi:hypothetical protein